MPNNKLSAFLVFVLTAIFYTYTLLPSLAWGDGIKLQSEAISGESFVLAEMPANEFTPDAFIFSKVGVAAWDHPLYIVIGHLFIKAFHAFDSLWLINFMSAIFGAASVALIFLLSHRFTESLLAACYASFSLAFSHTFWWHSSTPEVYTLLIFLLLASFYLFDQYERNNNSSLFFSGFFLGLAASNHLLAFLIIPALGLYYLSSGRFRNLNYSNYKNIGMPVIAFLAGFSLYIIQFIRMSANFPLNEIMGPIIGSTFLSQLVTLSPLLLGKSILTYILFLTVQFGPVGLILGGFGIRKISQHKDFRLRKIIFSFIVFALFGIIYRVTDQFTFFITSYIFWTMLMGIGLKYALSLLPKNRRVLISGIIGILLVATPFLYTILPRIADRYGLNDATVGIPKIGTGVRDGLAYYINPNKREDTGAYDFGIETISNLPPNSVVIAEWYTDTDEYFILRYFAKIKKIRSDVTVVGWENQDPFNFDSQQALEVVRYTLSDYPVYLASLSDKFYAASKLIEMYCILPENNLYRIHKKENNTHQCLGSDSVTE